MSVSNREELVEHLRHGNRVHFLFFWGHQKSAAGIGKTCLSQWYESPFEAGGTTYLTAEHYMMAEKARLFGDGDTRAKILASTRPDTAKALGRVVAGFDDRRWAERRFDIVVAANLEKFQQNPDLKTFLLGTGDSVLVEASPVDSIWGIGLAADDPNAGNPAAWKGLNLLGFALMQVRDRLRCQTDVTAV